MATSLNTSATEEKVDYFRLQLLIIDFGTIILRHKFHQIVPSADLESRLKDTNTYRKLNSLRNKNAITSEQWYLLYPLIGKPDSEKFDISLLCCLLLNICGLQSHTPRWVPPSMDTSIEADLLRIRQTRNEICHRNTTSMNQQQFQTTWSEMEQVMLRLGTGIPSLKVRIQNLKYESLDPDKEREYQRKIKEWDEIDKSLQKTIYEMNSKLQESMEEISEVKVHLDKTVTGIEKKIETIGGIQEQEIRRLEELDILHRTKLTDIESKQTKLEQDVTDITVKVKSENGTRQISPELEHLFSMTKLHMEDTERDEVYVETSAHVNAKEILKKRHCLILTGLPGEGKTTMATKLISEIANPDTVLKLSEPSDWKLFNLNQISKPGLIFIDDIFGAGCFDESLHRGWSKYLPDIEEAVRKKKLSVLITTRHYILEEAKEKMYRSQLFSNENVIILDSTKLNRSERTQLLKNHLKHEEKEFVSSFIQQCDSKYLASTSPRYQYLPSSGFTDISSYIWGDKRIGFPEIVSLFVRNEQLYKQGAAFFQKPAAFFKQCMEDLFRDEEKYLALILIWTQPDKVLQVRDLELPGISKNIEKIIELFGFGFKSDLSKVLRKSLRYHKNGFLKFDAKSGTYSFWHNIIKDMAGLVASKEYPEAILECADKEFIMQYVTTDKEKDDGFHFYIEDYRFQQLFKIISGKVMYNSSKFRRHFDSKYIDGVYDEYVLNVLEFKNKTFNVSSLRHDCFSNRSFIALFFGSAVGKVIASRRVATLSKKIISPNGFDLGWQKNEIFLPTLALTVGNVKLMEEFLKNKLYRESMVSSQFLVLSLLIAAHCGLESAVDMLLDYGTVVNENIVSVAAVKGNEKILETLLERGREKDELLNTSNPLIAAVSQGRLSSVKILINYGVDVNLRDENDLSALDEAVLCRRFEMCRLLLEKGANVNARDTNYKRTPLHIIADLGRREAPAGKREDVLNIVQLLTENGASVSMRDFRGHYPIHCAAIRKQNDIVEKLLKADISQASLRIKSYGNRSCIKGMDLFHIAVWKNNIQLIDILLQNDTMIDPNIQDFYGRTPFYRAVYEGKQEIVEKLLRVANVGLAEKTGYTPLHAAVLTRNTEMVKLVCPFADVNAKDKYGKSPIHIACEINKPNIFKILAKDHRADIRMLTNKGQTIFTILEKQRNRRIGEFRQIVESIDNEFACNWEQLSLSSSVARGNEVTTA